MALYIMTWEQVAAVALAAGWSDTDAVTAVAITQPESGRQPRIVQAGQPYATTGWGLWQITPGNSVPRFGTDGQLLDPTNNAGAAHWKWAAAGGWSPWTTWENGLERPFLPFAANAVATVAHLTPAQRRKLIADARAAAGRGGGAPGQVSDWSPQVRAAARAAGKMAGRAHTHGAYLRKLRPPVVRPTLTVPAASNVLWRPGQPLPTRPEEK